MEKLIEDYKRKVNEIKDICPITDEQMWKLKAKEQCYRTFISELEAIEKPKDDMLIKTCECGCFAFTKDGKCEMCGKTLEVKP